MTTDNKINILFVLPSLKRGGAEMQVIDLIKWFDRDIFNVYLFTFSNDLILLDNLKDINFRHYNHPRKYKFDFSMLPVLSNIIKDNNIDVIHCSLQIGLLVGWLSSILLQKKPKIINTLHRTVGRNIKEEILEVLVYQWPMRACNKIICVCKKQELFWLKRFPFLKSKTEVIYNGIDKDKFNPSNFTKERLLIRQDLEIPNDSLIITCVAGLRIEKNHIGLLDAFNIAIKSEPNIYLLFAGDGKEKSNIEQYIKEKNLSKNTRLLGNISDIRPILSASDLTVIASTSIETFSIAMLESMSMERPVLSTDIGGHSEAIINNVTGRIVEINKTEELAEAIVWFSRNREKIKNMGANSRNSISKSFTVETMVSSTQNLIMRTLNK